MNHVSTKEVLDIMKRRGVSMETLADEMKVSTERLDSTLNGYTYLSDNNAILIMDALSSLKKKNR